VRILEPTDDAIAEASEALRRGELVGMPTETVYGIAAVATDPDAVRKIFIAKGRPSDNPLIVHVYSLEQLETVAREIPASATALANRFWPGPLTLVLPKLPSVPHETTAGLGTVAVRMPSHPVALRLLREVGLPLAAPSANPFMSLSPTRAQDIDGSLAEHLALVLDGGAAEVGVESTVVDCTTDPVRVLRPGGVARADLAAVLGYEPELGGSPERRSPGQYRRHYAPRTPVVLVEILQRTDVGLTFHQPAPGQISMPREPAAYAAVLYSALRELDQKNVERIVVQKPPETPEWEVVWDRLRKATG
jgi:L-threonylcarbamoyladenylate synthase